MLVYVPHIHLCVCFLVPVLVCKPPEDGLGAALRAQCSAVTEAPSRRLFPECLSQEFWCPAPGWIASHPREEATEIGFLFF